MEAALEAFEGALRARERDPENPEAVALARYAVGKALRGLGRAADAVPCLEQAVAWTKSVGSPDGWFHQELAEDYAALGLESDAREHARIALELLPNADPAFASDVERSARLRELAE